MNYPFSKKSSLGRFVSLALVLVMTLTLLSGCSLLPFGQNTEPSTEDTSSNLPNLVEETDPPTVPPTTEATEPATEARKENVAVVKEQLNIRSSPSTGSRVITQLDAGEEVEVLRIEPIGTVQWAYVSSETLNVMGWIVTDMLDMSNVQLASGGTSTPASSGEPLPTNAPTVATETTAPVVNELTGTGSSNTGSTIPANAKMGVVKANDLNIRSSASTNGDRIGSYSYGDRIAILETNNGWGRTEKGWVSLNYVYMDGDVGTNSVYGTVTATQLNVRSGPGTNYDRVKSLNQHDRIQIMEQIKVGNTTWGYVSGGWVAMDYVSVEGANSNPGAYVPSVPSTPSTPAAGTATVTGSGLNVRAGAGTSFQIVGALKQGDVVTILETVNAEGYQWGRINNGWICLNYVRMN